MVKDTDIQWALTAPTGNDHRNAYSVHIWNAVSNMSQIKMFYAYKKTDALEVAREYIVRFMSPDYQIVSAYKE
jgi:hypothetical protein